MDKDQLNDELKRISVDGLKQLGDWIHEAKNFAIEQAPLFAQEYARWWTVSNAIEALAWLTALIPLWWFATKGAKMVFAREALLTRSDQGMYTFFGFCLRAGCSVGCFVCFFHGCDRMKDASKGYFAPRVVVVEGIRDIVAGNTETSCRK